MDDQGKRTPLLLIADRDKLFRWIYTAVLLAAAINVWYNIWAAQFEEYDKDWAMVLSAFVLSVLVSLGIILFRIFKRELSLRVHWPSVIFLIGCSPVTVGIVVFNYGFFFGQQE